MNPTEHINYSEITSKRISKLAHLTDEEKKELLNELTLSDDMLKASKPMHKNSKSTISSDASEYLSYYNNNINKQLETSKENELWPRPSLLLEDSKNREYLVKMFFTLNQRHSNYYEEKKNYTPEQLAIVNKIEKESGGKVKCVVDTNFLKAFWKITWVDYRWAWVLGKWVIVASPENLTRESLLRHEAIHCAQQRDMWFFRWLGFSLIDSKIKQFFWPQKWTASAVDYWTDNQATDLETYMNQYNPDYLPNRQKNDHRKYYNKNFLQWEYKRMREEKFIWMQEQLKKLENKWDNLSFEEQDKIKELRSDIQQYEKILDNLENDEEIRTVLVEPDVLPSKMNNNLTSETAQVWTESKTNMEKRIQLEKNLYNDTVKKLEGIINKINNFTWTKEEKDFLEWEIQAYKNFLNAIKNDQDKSRSKAKQDRRILLEKRKEYEKKLLEEKKSE